MDTRSLSIKQKALLEFILHEWATTLERRHFNTSWTTCSLCETPEEKLLFALMPDGNWLTSLPDVLFEICLKASIETDSGQFELISAFLLQAIEDLFACEVRDNA